MLGTLVLGSIEEEGRRTDIVVLACTHYPFLANRFRKLAPWPVDWLNPAEAIALQAPGLSNVELIGADVSVAAGASSVVMSSISLFARPQRSLRGETSVTVVRTVGCN